MGFSSLSSAQFFRGSFVLLLGFLLFFVATAPASAAEGTINTGYFGNVAIKGYDPVAYFTKGRAIKGNEGIKLKWLGAYWLFSSEAHKNLFDASPQSYAPQYGGHCATGMAISGGLTRDIDPEAWAIIDNKLYLNYSKETNTLLTGKIIKLEKADENWKNGAKATH